MSEGYNRWVGLGNLAMDPELRMTSGGQAVLKLRLACGESYKGRDGNRQERTEFVNCVIWGRRAEALGKFLGKGDRLLVEGSLRTSSYEDREGVKKYRTEIIAQNVVLSGGGRNNGGGNRRSDADEGGRTGGGGYDDADYGGVNDDEIPF